MLKHVAFIMDGNGRCASNQNKERSFGHEVGFKNMFSIIEELLVHKVEEVSFYCFSTENWNRPVKEVDFLMEIPKFIYKSKEYTELKKQDVSVKFCGLKNRIPKNTLKFLELVEDETKNNKTLKCNLMFDYGSITEIKEMVQKIVESDIKLVTEDDIFSNLYVSNKIDLMIRTGKEKRLSNFMLLQLAYSELYFSNSYWPEFTKNELNGIFIDFHNRNRTYGTYKEDKNEN